jgi:F0F1-type ATP synthase assembly protein I
MEDNLQRGEPMILAAYGLIGAILLLGAAGFVVDRIEGSSPWGVLIGLLAGLCVGFLWLARVVRRS